MPGSYLLLPKILTLRHPSLLGCNMCVTQASTARVAVALVLIPREGDYSGDPMTVFTQCRNVMTRLTRLSLFGDIEE